MAERPGKVSREDQIAFALENLDSAIIDIIINAETTKRMQMSDIVYVFDGKIQREVVSAIESLKAEEMIEYNNGGFKLKAKMDDVFPESA